MSHAGVKLLIALEKEFPNLRWRTPIIDRRAGVTRYGCRVCIGTKGDRGGNQRSQWPTTYGEWERHFVTEHVPREPEKT